eukprot:CAMPEP_0203751840 /NCGR_PEP_ID=MMETSP0098-20131031/5840_1 /ASSEMBLY_ACC=CAM_ASM_000208 /TAXON_ID=96639 /ORGANISM=" , Strain NY0313808BC1" /LENGTH=223 /DNA_ID=CAMNT_0050641737 /DNA_START=492 /DNA_END=1160 /DNA_ORIENTATION=-
MRRSPKSEREKDETRKEHRVSFSAPSNGKSKRSSLANSVKRHSSRVVAYLKPSKKSKEKMKGLRRSFSRNKKKNRAQQPHDEPGVDIVYKRSSCRRDKKTVTRNRAGSAQGRYQGRMRSSSSISKSPSEEGTSTALSTNMMVFMESEEEDTSSEDEEDEEKVLEALQTPAPIVFHIAPHAKKENHALRLSKKRRQVVEKNVEDMDIDEDYSDEREAFFARRED